MPRAASAAPISFAVPGSTVAKSMQRRPAGAVAATPPSPRKTSRDCSGVTRQAQKTSTAAATSATEPATRAPSARSLSTDAALALCTTSSCPARAMFDAMGTPMSPSPTKPIRIATPPLPVPARILCAGHGATRTDAPRASVL